MATQIVIINNDSINVDNGFLISWKIKGDAMPAIPDTIHCVIWNDLPGQNEIQNKDPSTGNMTGNTSLTATSDAVGSTTVQALLDWAQVRMDQCKAAQAEWQAATDAESIGNDVHWESYL